MFGIEPFFVRWSRYRKRLKNQCRRLLTASCTNLITGRSQLVEIRGFEPRGRGFDSRPRYFDSHSRLSSNYWDVPAISLLSSIENTCRTPTIKVMSVGQLTKREDPKSH